MGHLLLLLFFCSSIAEEVPPATRVEEVLFFLEEVIPALRNDNEDEDWGNTDENRDKSEKSVKKKKEKQLYRNYVRMSKKILLEDKKVKEKLKGKQKRLCIRVKNVSWRG